MNKIYLIGLYSPGDFQPGTWEIETKNYWLNKDLVQAECDK